MSPFPARRASLRRRLVKPLTWALLGLLIAVDALIASNISVGLLYFFPLSVAALTFPRRGLIGVVVVCIVGRILFGPTGDPLGLETVSFRFSRHTEVLFNGFFTALGYSAVGTLLLRMRKQMRRLHQLDQEVETDPLTAVGNRRALARVFADLVKNRQEASVLCVDIDHFKKINDTHGHEMGDRVLQQLAERLTLATRGPDLVARSGGEEFVVVLPRTDQDEAAIVAERIRLAICEEPMRIGELALQVTISVGVAAGAPPEPLLARADQALYEAKRTGRNRVVCAPPPGVAAAA